MNSERMENFAPYPWRRYFARMLDFSVYELLYSFVLAAGFHQNLLNHNTLGWKVLNTFVVMAVMLFVEPLLLSRFRTTPGKWIFGIQVTAGDGGKPSYMQGLSRTWIVLWMGCGLYIPIISMIRLWLSYKGCSEQRPLAWEDELCCSIRDRRIWRCTAFVLAAVLLTLSLIPVNFLGQRLPNRAPLNKAEFVENYNFLCRYYDQPFYLVSGGNGKLRSGFFSTPYISLGQGETPEFHYETEGGELVAVSFFRETGDNMVRSDTSRMMLAALAFAGAEKEAGIFSGGRKRILEQINNSGFQSFRFTEAGITIECSLEYTGYEVLRDAQMLFGIDGEEQHYSIHFSMGRQ